MNVTPEQDATRRLLFANAKYFRTKALYAQYLEDISTALGVSDELIAEATNAYVFQPTQNNESDSAPTSSQIQCAYRILLLVGDDSFEEALGIIKDIIPLSDGNVETIKKGIIEHGKPKNNPYSKPPPKPTSKSNPFTISKGTAEAIVDSTKSSKKGRKVGGRNKEGHGAGGDRKSITFHSKKVLKDKQQKQFSTMLGNGDKWYSSDSSSDEEGGSDDEDNIRRRQERMDRRKAHEERKAKQNAIAALEKYAESFPNGSIDTPVDHDEFSDEIPADGRQRRAYQPVDGTPIKEYLDDIKEKVTNNKLLDLEIGEAWVPPLSNPLSKSFGSSADPNRYYVGKVWVFVFDPMTQFKRWMPAKHECIHCKSNNTRYYAWAWQPYHWWDKIVYVLHRRVRCEDCNGTFATVNARALENLPTPVSEQFPFMSPSQYGPGIYAPMILMLVALMPHAVYFGSFAKIINQLQRINFAQSHVSYLDAVDHWLNVQPPPKVDSLVPAPFSPYKDQTGYCGIELLGSLLNGGLKMYMTCHEQYQQASFQLAVDDGCSTDDSHKLTKHIVATVDKKKCKPYTATYTVMAKNGKVNVSRHKFTKSSDELKEVIPAWAKVRINAGQPELLRVEGDNAAADISKLQSAFPSLLKDVVPFQEYTALPRYIISEKDYSYITSRPGCESIALAAVAHINELKKAGGNVRIGLDTEFDSENVHVIALYIDRGPKVLIHPYGWGNTFEPHMKKILEMPEVIVIGVNIAKDVHWLRDRFGIKIKRMRELRRYCLLDNPNQKTGLKDLGANYLGQHIDKNHQTSDFSVEPALAKPMRDYAMIDGILPILLDDAITAKLVNAGSSSLAYPPDLQRGSTIIIKIGGRRAAEATLEFLGDRCCDNGESRMWGSLYVGESKALVKIINVLSRSAKVPFQRSNWGPEKLTLGEVVDRLDFDGEIAIRASQIHSRINGCSTSVAQATAISNEGMNNTCSLAYQFRCDVNTNLFFS